MNGIAANERLVALSDALTVISAVIGLILGGSLTLGAPDPVMAFHGLLLAAGCGVAIIFLHDRGFRDGSLAGIRYRPDALGLFLVTALASRVWCGYACPQTVWTDLMIAV